MRNPKVANDMYLFVQRSGIDLTWVFFIGKLTERFNFVNVFYVKWGELLSFIQSEMFGRNHTFLYQMVILYGFITY